MQTEQEDFDTLPERQPLARPLAAMLGNMETKTCEIHGEYGTRFLCGRYLPCPVCSDILIAEQDSKRDAQLLDERRAQCLKWAAIPARFAECGMRNYQRTCSRRVAAHDAASAYLRALRSDVRTAGNLVMYGRTGNGKTHLACGILRTMAHHCHRVRYATSAEILADAIATWSDKTQTEKQVITRYGEYELLVIDELGTNDDFNKAGQRIIEAVIDARYLNGLPTIGISNLMEQDLAKALGDRAYDRLCDNSQLLRFDWESYRQRNVRRA